MKPVFKVIAGGCVLAAAMSGASGAEPQGSPALKSGSSSLEVVPSDGMPRAYDPQATKEMHARLEDPQQRAILREQRQEHAGSASAIIYFKQ